MDKTWKTSKPLRMWIDGRCFNIKPYDKLKRSVVNKAAPNKDLGCTSQELEHNYIINSTDDGKFATRFCLPSRYYRCLSYFPHFSVKHLAQETQTEISIPVHSESGYITISGKNEPDIVSAREIIQSVVGEIREKEFVQQFVAIPVNSEEIKQNVERFKEEILNGDPIEGMDVSIFQSSLKLHLTIAVFSLLDDMEKNEAVTALNDCKIQVIEPLMKEAQGPLKITVAGIECMNNDMSKVNILYAKAKMENEKEDLLQTLANNIANFFYGRGLIRQYQDNVKLHVTLLNTKYRKVGNSPAASPRKHWVKRKPFDARSIIEKYKDYHFGEAVFDSVHLCHIHGTGEDGFYKPLSVITL